ncbi:MAG: bifunctional phosphopantothenoylcysteine decarboxylase/phosphopantothenate--cysteine ligase CoaBC [Rickettsiales bacterium]|nr:bifunctional phosphopantothenoylcysteine decarboxylase/phosphopantothenate--cysteine ligase CoaBC [Rickettsiales bacterium]
MLTNKNILIGITGGISAYKICSLIRLFKKNNANVKVVVTENALNFVTKTILETLSQNKIYVDEFNNDTWKPIHIELSEWADIFVVAPASANTVAKIACGICDNLLTSTICAYNKKLVIVPTMNCNMWNNTIVQQNISKLKELENMYILNPNSGFLACGVNGDGRMAEPEEIFDFIVDLLNDNKFLSGKKFIVTAGGTKEPIDPIRCITNHSSGKMGIAMADEIHRAGGEVLLITTVSVNKPYKVIRVNTTVDILNEVKNNINEDMNVVMTASISDYRVENVSDQKIKKENNGELVLKLVQNPDVLKEIAKIRTDKQKIIGFCAETENVVENAIKKIKSKNLDYIVANDVSRKDIGFNVDYNEVVLIDKDCKQVKIDRDTKHNISRKVLENIFGDKK